MAKITVLYLDEDTDNRANFENACQSRDEVNPKTAESVEKGIDVAEESDIIISSFQIKEESGPVFFEKVSKKLQDNGYVLYSDEEESKILAKIGEIPFMLVRPADVSFDELVETAVNAYRGRQFSSYPVVEDESTRSKRAEAVSISDSQRQKLDELTNKVAAEFDADKAYVELMEVENQMFISTCGFEEDSMSRETSICTHALVHEDVYVIEDVKNDPRFVDNKQVQDLEIGFYAGAILTVGGLRIGTLCVTDKEPRSMSENEQMKLREYADRVESVIEQGL